jgi:hypothetical protein
MPTLYMIIAKTAIKNIIRSTKRLQRQEHPQPVKRAIPKRRLSNRSNEGVGYN